jgi:hypothetical protein
MVDAERELSASSGERGAAMQIPPEEQEFIRHAFHAEHKPIRQIERETGHCLQAIRRAISYPLSLADTSSPFRSALSFHRDRKFSEKYGGKQ